MKFGRPNWRVRGRIAGAVLLLSGIVLGVYWFHLVGPTRRMLDPFWVDMHSRKAYWLEAQKQWQRIRIAPPGFAAVFGFCGDKQWFKRLVDCGMDDRPSGGCNCGHVGLAWMANRIPTNTWPQWWEQNRTKSQEEWIRDGFSAYGLTIHLPPNASDVEPLLGLLGNNSTNDADQVPSWVKYNAFRWLRDSEFDPVCFAISNITASTSHAVKGGLQTYAKWEKIWPVRDGVGVLAFGRRSDASDECRPRIAERSFRAMVCVLVFGLTISGVGLIAVSLRRRNQVATR